MKYTKKQRKRLIKKLFLSITVTLALLSLAVVVLVKSIKTGMRTSDTGIKTDKSSYQSGAEAPSDFTPISKPEEPEHIDVLVGISEAYKNAGDPTNAEVYPVSSKMDIPENMDSSERAHMIIETYASENNIDITSYPQVVFDTFG